MIFDMNIFMNTEIYLMKLLKAGALIAGLGFVSCPFVAHALEAKEVSALVMSLERMPEIQNSRYVVEAGGDVRRAVWTATHVMQQAVQLRDVLQIHFSGQDSLVKAILNSMTNYYGWTMLHVAVKDASETNNLLVIEALLGIGANVHQPDINKKAHTPFEVALQYGNSEVISCLARFGARLTRGVVPARRRGTKRAKRQPVESNEEESKEDAACAGQSMTMKGQLAAEHVVMAVAQPRESSASIAREQAHVVAGESVAAVCLRQSNPRINGITPYHFNCVVERLIMGGDWNFLIMYIDHGDMGVNWVDACGSTLLMHAAGTGLVEAVKELIARGAAINAINRWGYPALLLAIEGCYPEVVTFLVDNGADIQRFYTHTLTGEVWNPLMRAVALRDFYKSILFGGVEFLHKQDKICTKLFSAREAFDLAAIRMRVMKQDDAAALLLGAQQVCRGGEASGRVCRMASKAVERIGVAAESMSSVGAVEAIVHRRDSANVVRVSAELHGESGEGLGVQLQRRLEEEEEIFGDLAPLREAFIAGILVGQSPSLEESNE